MCKACREDSVECVKLLIEDEGCRAGFVNQKDVYKYSSPLTAAQHGNPVIVRMIWISPGQIAI